MKEKAKVLVAEDSAVNRNILVHLLKKADFEVSEFPDGKAAWEEFKSQPKGTYKFIISDVMMPEMSGLEFLKCVRGESEDKEIPFVLLTAVSDKESILEAKAHAVNGYLLKPVTYEKVKKKLESLFPDLKLPAIAS